MAERYTADGKRKSSMTHARRSWTCPCGRQVLGNGGRSSHQRSCRVWNVRQIEVLRTVLGALEQSGRSKYTLEHRHEELERQIALVEAWPEGSRRPAA